MAVVKKLKPIDMTLEQLYAHEKFTPTIRKAILLKEDFSKIQVDYCDKVCTLPGRMKCPDNVYLQTFDEPVDILILQEQVPLDEKWKTGQQVNRIHRKIMGYMMNVSDATVEKTEDGYKLTTFTAYGYDPAYSDGDAYYAQYMLTASCDTLTEDTLFSDLTFSDLAQPDNVVTVEKACIAYGYLAREAGMDLTPETPVKDLLALHGLYADGTFVEGSNRVSFAGYNGGRSYGEQMEAITDYILANHMTLEDVYEMFRTVNQASTPIQDRDTIAGATITFGGDFQRMVYLAIHGELFEGVVTTTENEDGTTVCEVVTQGFGGEIETNVTFDANDRITAISVRDAQETDGVGGVLTADDSDYINALIAGQDDLDGVDAVSGATITSNALKQAVRYAQEAIAR